MPKLSIIVPTFNSAHCIERCLRSIRIQTFRDYEVIVQDGVSSDDTIGIARRFQDADPGMNIKVFSEKDAGVYDAMNKACRRANGEWLYFLGSDDELHDATVLAAVMGSPSLDSFDVLYGNVQVVGDAAARGMAPVYDGIFNLEKLLRKNVCHQAVFYRAAFHRRIGEYNTRYVTLADWDFNMRCWSRTEFRYLDSIVANFYVGGLSATGQDERFSREVAANVLGYFNLSIYDPLVDTPAFVGFANVVNMQLRAAPWRVSRVVRRHLALRAWSSLVSGVRNYVWHPILNLTRAIRHPLGLNSGSIRALLKKLT